MSLYTLPNATTPDDIIVETIAQVPAFPPLLLAFVFFIVFIGGIMRQSLRVGNADYSMWAVVASLITLVVALIMSTTSGFINITWLVITVVITIFSGLWFFLDKTGK